MDIEQPVRTAGTLTREHLDDFRRSFDSDSSKQIMQNVVTQRDVNEVALNRSIVAAAPHTFSTVLDDWNVTNQAKSGRCWMFAGLNLCRVETRDILNLKEFEFSQNYIMFWDKMERANYLLEAVIETADKPVDDRTVAWLLQSPISDGGQWDMFAALVKKHGAVPKSAMTETESSSNSSRMNSMLNYQMRQGAKKIRDSYSQESGLDEMRGIKNQVLQVIHHILCIHLGTPPSRFDWQWKSKDGKFTRDGEMTPREFAEKYVVTPLEEYVCLVNDPRESSPMGRTFTVAYLGNVVDAPPIKYLNVDIQFMKDITLRMLQDGKPVWMGCDTGKQMHRDLGLWDAELFDYEGVYGADFGLDKAARLEYHQTRMTHAMMFTGVDVVERQPRRWRVENSWDSKVGDKGFFLMNDSWFAEYMFEIAVPKDYLPAELQEALEQEPIVLPPWDPMGSLAHEQANASIEIDDVFRRFLKDQPSFEATRFLDALRAREYSRLDELNQVYLDYTGGGLYADSQIREHMELLRDGVFGNPHSTNPASAAATHYVEGARSFVLEYFNASPDEYVAIFTPNATGAIKLVGESYPFDPSSQFLLTFDNHNSVNGIREFARTKGAQVNYLPVVPPELRVDQNRLADSLGVTHDGGNKLFAYPAQSNFSGVQHPLSWIAQAQDQGWDVLVDCAAFVPTNKLDLSRWHPDFVPLSFYKMFGYPTGVGCLIARKSALAKLIKPWFAGGTITMASVQAQGHHLAEGEAAFEEGTVNYLNLPGVEFGLRHLESIGMEPIHHRVGCLTSWLLDQLLGLRHGNGSPLIRIYGPANMDGRGGVVTMNFYGRDGALIDHRKIEALANKVNISLRTGCFCNPGAGEVAHGLTTEEMERAFADGQRMTFEQFISVLESSDGKSAGAVRVSLGMVTNFADVYRFTEFARSLLN